MKKLSVVILPAIIAALIVISGCTTRIKVDDAPVAASMPSGKLERGKAVYIAIPHDGTYGDKVYSGSGKQAALALHLALAQYASPVIMGEKYEDQTTALESAKAKNAKYVFVPLITNWVHRKAAWSGRASGVSMTVSVFDLTSASGNQLVMQKDLRVQGRNVTFKSQYPEEILKPLCVNFAQEIY